MTKFSKKLCVILATFCLVMAMATCFASGEQSAFVDEIAEGITPDNMWGAVAPYAKIILAIFIFAFAYGILRKVLKKGSRGKFGM